MTSKPNAYIAAYVWIWLPTETQPVVAGKLTAEGPNLVFNYGKSYLERQDKISIYEAELPLKSGLLPLLPGLSLPSCIRDGAPDAWGRRVLINRKFGALGKTIDEVQVDELTFLLESGSDRIGALDFQLSPTKYVPRLAEEASLEDLQKAAENVEKGIPLATGVETALYHGSPIGGARPKALISAKNHKYIAKFSSTSDVYNVIKLEFLAMRLATLVGLNVTPVSLEKCARKDVLLIERFDRVKSKKGWQRKNMLSALTLLGLDEMMARYASYQDLAEIIRHRFTKPKVTLCELFQRMVFNILVGNTDDHARNHAAFWDGKNFSLTPAYDICPQPRTGNVASQAMAIADGNNSSRLSVCLDAAGNFLLSRKEALEIIEAQTQSIVKNWSKVCEESQISTVERKLFSNRQFLNPYILEGLGEQGRGLSKLIQSFES